MIKYEIICLQNAPLSSWSEPHTGQEIIDKFYDYATMEWEDLEWDIADNIEVYSFDSVINAINDIDKLIATEVK